MAIRKPLIQVAGQVKELPVDDRLSLDSIDIFIGDDGTGGTKGLVPAPAVGDATKFLRGDGVFASAGGTDAIWGNITGTLSAQTDLQGVLDTKLSNPVTITGGTIAGTAISRTNTAQSLPVVAPVVTPTKTLTLSDANTIQACNNAAAQTITIPAAGTVPFAVDTFVVFQQLGAGLVTVQGEAGVVTINGSLGGSVVTTGQRTALYLIKTSTNTWEAISANTGFTALTGDVTAAGVGSVAATVNSIDGKLINLGGDFAISGAFSTTFNVTGNTNLTLPTGGTLLAAGASSSFAASASQSVLQFTGALLTGGSSTSNFPAFYFNQGATSINTFTTSGTYFGVNAASGFAGNFIDFQINNGGSVMKLASNGNLTCTGTFQSNGTITSLANITATNGSLTLNATGAVVFSGNARIKCTGAGALSVRNSGDTADGSLTALDVVETNNKRVTAQFDMTSSTVLTNITGLSASVVAGATYAFEANLYTSSNVAGGVKAAIGGTATATAIIYDGMAIGTAVTKGRASALGAAVAAVTAETVALISIKGTITVNAAGTLTVQFAQNASNAAASSVLVGSTLILNRIA